MSCVHLTLMQSILSCECRACTLVCAEHIHSGICIAQCVMMAAEHMCEMCIACAWMSLSHMCVLCQ
jgi:hypothetical protein